MHLATSLWITAPLARITICLMVLILYTSVAGAQQSIAAQAPPTPPNDPLVVALQAQINEMRRSEDRLLSTVWWALGVVGAVAVALGVFSWWSNYRVYERDKQSLRDELTKTVEEARSSLEQRLVASIDLHLKQLRGELLSEHSRLVNYVQTEGFAYTLGHIADIRLFLHDVEGALRAGIEQYSCATQSNSNYIAHALDKPTDALKIAIQDQCRVSDALLARIIHESETRPWDSLHHVL